MCAVFIFSWCSRKAAYSVWDVHDIVAANYGPDEYGVKELM